MKTPLIATLTFALSLLPCFSQGYIGFNNTFNTRISTGGVLQAAAPVGSWYYALLVAPSTQNTIDNTTSHAFDAWTFVGLGTNTGVAGRLSGNTTTDGMGIQVPGFGTTAACDFVVVGWSANIGSDWNTIRAGYMGYYDDGVNSGYGGTWAIVDPSKPGGSSYIWFGVSSVAQDIPLAPIGGAYNSVFGSAAGGQIPGLNLIFPSIPEPSNWTLLGVLGLAILVVRKRRAEPQLS
jgi:hypothetical protein